MRRTADGRRAPRAASWERGSMAQTPGWGPLLRVAHELAGRLSPATLAAAEPMALAPTEWLDAGEGDPRSPADEGRAAHLGPLVIDGLLAPRGPRLPRPAAAPPRPRAPPPPLGAARPPPLPPRAGRG